jgi:alginate O-acetyltransferase complex protein AlgI
MQIASLAFLGFFALITALNYVIPNKWRWLMLLGASYAFYATWRVDYVFVILAITLVSYFIALGMERFSSEGQRRLLLWVGLIFVLSGLIAFMYFDFFSSMFAKVLWRLAHVVIEPPKLGLIAPIGISFYTLQVVSYLIDVYHKTMKAEKHFGYYSLYVSFFPQIISGPISRAKMMLPQYREPKEFDEARIVTGLRMVLWGAFQKLAIADRLGLLVNQYYGAPEESSGLQLVYATYLFSFQILADFSGYTNMARGMARVLGLELAENFNQPYFSRDANEFWNRWHMSFSTWLRDYIFYPVMRFMRKNMRWAGTFVSMVVPPMVTMFVSGLWHGVGLLFIFWGLLHGFYLVLSTWTAGWRKRVLSKENLGGFVWVTDLVQMLVTFHLITGAWVLFRSGSIADARLILSKIAHVSFEFPSIDVFYFVLAVFLVLVLMVGEYLHGRNLRAWYARQPRALRWGIYILAIIALLYFGMFGKTEFIYAQF